MSIHAAGKFSNSIIYFHNGLIILKNLIKFYGIFNK